MKHKHSGLISVTTSRSDYVKKNHRLGSQYRPLLTKRCLDISFIILGFLFVYFFIKIIRLVCHQNSSDALLMVVNNTEKDIQRAVSIESVGSIISRQNSSDSTALLIVVNNTEKVIENLIPAESIRSMDGMQGEVKVAILGVGGTDGSGTRRVVQILTQLGVKMVAEDQIQFDINAESVGGWPEVIIPVLQYTHSVNYRPDDLPEELREKTRASIKTIINDVGQYSTHKIYNTPQVKCGGVIPSIRGVQAEKISYGFKAPVVISLCPWFAEEIPHFRFLHVVRDGRDIAFSGNQSPVEKFFNVSFENFLEIYNLPLSVKAIKLWSHWNSDALAWAKKMVLNEKVNGQQSNRSFDYLVINMEEVVHQSPAVRYKTIKRIAHWVGSSASVRSLCCYAILDSTFLGTHDSKSSPSSTRGMKMLEKETLETQYGKWKAKLNGSAELEALLIKEGHEGLEKFGYLSDNRFQEDPEYSSICHAFTIAECNTSPPMISKFSRRVPAREVQKSLKLSTRSRSKSRSITRYSTTTSASTT